jgi:hypothetical protein
MTKKLYEEPFPKPPAVMGRVSREKPGLVEPTFMPVAGRYSASNSYDWGQAGKGFHEFGAHDLSSGKILAISVVPGNILNAVAEGKDLGYYAPYLVFTMNWVNRLARVKAGVVGFFTGIKLKLWLAKQRVVGLFSKKQKYEPLSLSSFSAYRQFHDREQNLDRILKCYTQYGLTTFLKNEERYSAWEAFLKALEPQKDWGAQWNKFRKDKVHDFAENLSKLPESLASKLPAANAGDDKNDKRAETLDNLCGLLESSLAVYYDHFKEGLDSWGYSWEKTKEDYISSSVPYLTPKAVRDFNKMLSDKVRAGAKEEGLDPWRIVDFIGMQNEFLKENPTLIEEELKKVYQKWQEEVVAFFKS